MQKYSLWVIVFFFTGLLAIPNAAGERDRGIRVIQDLSHQSGKLGTYRALIIGIDQYRDPKIPDLKTARNDARSMAKVLKESYGFQTTLLLDDKATKEAVFNALRHLASATVKDDSVLIYYAGHGDLDRLYNDGWWIPSDAKAGNPLTYLENVQVQKAMRSMPARHVLLISDSCYSGTLFGQARAMPPVITDKYYLNLYNEKSRWGLTSGNKEPVSDTGTESNSVFAYQLLKVLRQNDKPYVSTQEIYTRIAPIVGNNSEQTPLCRPIRNTGDQGGEFVFVASSGAVISDPEPISTKSTLEINSSVNNASVYLDGRNLGRTPLPDTDVTPGSHRIRVEKDGYEAYTRKVNIEPGRSVSLYVDLTLIKPRKGRLYVDVEPEDAKVRIINIGPAFYQGIELEPGQYHVEVSAVGYDTKSLWVSLSAGEDKQLDIRLKLLVTTESKSRITNSLGMDFVYIKPGTFMMGSPSNESGRLDREKQHRVTLTKVFYMQTTEVTVGQFRRFVREAGYKTEAEKGGGAYIWTGSKWEMKPGTYWDNPGFSQTDNHPVTCVSYNDVQAFNKWLNQKEGGNKYRLPTEAQWEYACRAGTTTPFSFGNCLSTDQANYNGNYPLDGCSKGQYRGKTSPVASFSPNAWGLNDMHGNVWEWCQDWYGDYPSGSITDPEGVSSGSYRVLRGGSWLNYARYCRSAYRNPDTPDSRSNHLGFRLTRTP